MAIQYRLPAAEDEALLGAYVAEHAAAGEFEISAGMGLGEKDFSRWLAEVLRSARCPGGDWGRSDLLLCFRGGELAGLLNVRYELSEALRWQYGDIGYGVRPSLRGQGCAGEMLRHGLDLCRTHGMGDAVLGCYKDNLPSAKTILKNGGVLVREYEGYTKGRLSQYYRIPL